MLLFLWLPLHLTNRLSHFFTFFVVIENHHFLPDVTNVTLLRPIWNKQMYAIMNCVVFRIRVKILSK